MALGGHSAMLNWSDVAPEHRESYYEWHNREHMFTAVELPGFLRGRRFIALRADRTFFNIYEVADLGVFSGPDYTARTARPSELTRRTTAHVRNAIRGLSRVRFTRGTALGGIMLTLRFAVDAQRAQAFEHHLVSTVLPRLLEHSPQVLAAHFCTVDQGASSVVTPERQGRPTAVPHSIVLVEGVSPEGLDAAADAHLADPILLDQGATGPFERGLYRLEMMAVHGAPSGS
jgi:hypothetical protein